MKNVLLGLILLFSSIALIAQSSFERGYFITNQNEKVICFIYNNNSNNIQQYISYKTDENSEIKEIDTKLLKTVVVLPNVKFERHKVSIDLSSNLLGEMSTSRLSNYEEKELFLRVLLEGEVSLYMYSKSNITRYFYAKDSKLIPLEYKKYLKNNAIGKNINYQKQLKDDLSCSTNSKLKTKIKYNTKALVKYFTQYNKCIGANVINHTLNNKKYESAFNIAPIITVGSINITSESPEYNTGTKSSHFTSTIGVAFQYRIGVAKNKWGVFAAPSYQTQLSASAKVFDGFVSSAGPSLGLDDDEIYQIRRYKTVNTTYSAFRVPVGVKYYFNTKTGYLALVPGFGIEIPINSSIHDLKTDTKSDFTKISTNLSLGAEMNINKFNIGVTFRQYLGLENTILNNGVFFNLSYIIK